MEKRPAMLSAISYSAITILTSATILTVCGAFIGIISSNGVIAGLGTLIGRGAFIAALNTFLLLPILFMVLDKVVEKTTWKARFYHGDDRGTHGGNNNSNLSAQTSHGKEG